MNFTITPIGIIHTPYSKEHQRPPFQSVESDPGEFYVEVYQEHTERLDQLDTFSYIYLLYWLDKANRAPQQKVTPPWIMNTTVGLFASRSPNRINPIGLSVVQVKKIINNRIDISGIDAFDTTPLIDIKPYIKDVDMKPNANNGWLETIDNQSKEKFKKYFKIKS